MGRGGAEEGRAEKGEKYEFAKSTTGSELDLHQQYSELSFRHWYFA